MEKKRSVYLIFILFLIGLLLPTVTAFGQEEIQDPFARQQALRLIENLSVVEKVGQLFLVTFDGSEIAEESVLFELINDFKIGGLVFKQENGNIPPENSGFTLRDFIRNLQLQAFESSEIEEPFTSQPEDQFIPLFIGVSQLGGSYPYDQVFSGLSSNPSPMAIGATWDKDLAIRAGESLGSELESAGFNLLFGPSMDVLDSTFSQFDSSLGVRTFGGDPFWVGELGGQFISGLHRGSSGRLAVISKNFPGRGSTDRLPEEEVSTVRKSLEQLKLIELAPFFKITETESVIPASITDGLVTSHIRYQGFQGNIRATTKPISFDQNAIDLLMNIPPLQEWRANGGILISDDLGSQAVSRFFNPENRFLDARQIAKNAFLAGNDVIYMDDLLSTGDENRFQTYRDIIMFFQEKYDEDPVFAQEVEEAVVRILTLKYSLYDEFTIDRVLPDGSAFLSSIEVNDLQFEIAQKGATLINPTQNQLSELITEPPQINEQIVIFTQEQTIIPCENCNAIDVFPVNGLEQSIINLYGPNSSGQISDTRIVSYTFRDLLNYLDTPTDLPGLQQNLSDARWVVFVHREIYPDDENDDALSKLIAENRVALRDKNVIVFSFDAPYYFDATEISTFTAYYCLYSKLPAFIDVAARILFQEIIPSSAPPVSISGIGYDLIENLSPDPDQIIPLSVDEEAAEQLLSEEQSGNTLIPETPVFKLGDILPVMTGVISDHNGNPVPDGTVVTFSMAEQGAATTIQQVEAESKGGVAKASFALLSPSMHEIKVSANPALNSEILLLDITTEIAIVSEIIPTPNPISESPELDGEIEEVTTNAALSKLNSVLLDWIFAIIATWIYAILLFTIIRDYFPVFDNYLISGSGLIGGLFNTVWMVWYLPGTNDRIGQNGYVRLAMVVLMGVFIGAIFGWMLLRLKIVKSGKDNS